MAAGPTQAQDGTVVVEGQRFARRAQVAGTELLLNGTGVRAVAWFKGYAAGLYLPSRAKTLAAVLEQRGPKRLQLRMMQDVPAAEFTKALQKGITRNSNATEQLALAARVQRFADLITSGGAVSKGEVIDLDFDPTRGLLFSRNGTLRGEAIAGDDFYAALLRAFIGEHPYDERLRAGLRALPASNASGSASGGAP